MVLLFLGQFPRTPHPSWPVYPNRKVNGAATL